MDITKMTIEQLKALAYDQMVELNIIQRNINSIENEIAKRKNKETVKEGKPLRDNSK